MAPTPSIVMNLRMFERPERANNESIVKALLEDIASDMQPATMRDVAGGTSPRNRRELYWNVCLDEPESVEVPAGDVLHAIVLGSDRIPPAEHQTVAAEPETRGTIVLAEDDDATRALLSRVLARAGFTVHAYENGKLACSAVRQNSPDAVVLDWMMPVMDGPTAVADLKSDLDTRGIPVVMLSSESGIEGQIAALESGVQDFVTKPFDARNLVARIEQQIRWRKMLTVDASAAVVRERPERYRLLEGDSLARIDRTLVHECVDRIGRALPKRMA